jgi:hypothetical protein
VFFFLPQHVFDRKKKYIRKNKQEEALALFDDGEKRNVHKPDFPI